MYLHVKIVTGTYFQVLHVETILATFDTSILGPASLWQEVYLSRGKQAGMVDWER
jgi:hypothetical protein